MSRRVLIAFGMPLMQEAVKKAALSWLGFDAFFVASDTDMLFSALGQRRQDLVVLEANFPPNGATGALQMIRSNSLNAEVPVIVVVLEMDPNLRDSLMGAKADAVILGGYTFEKLRATVDVLKARGRLQF